MNKEQRVVFESMLMSNEEFIQFYSDCLREYLEKQYTNKAHQYDLAVANINFAEAMFIILGQLESKRYKN